MKIGRKLRTAAATAAVGLASVVSTGCSMISEFSPLFKPNEISSTHKQRGQFEFGRQIEKLHKSGEAYTLNEDSDTLFVRAENFHETLENFGIENNGTFNELFETNRVEIKYRNPQTGEVVSETQIVANDGTIDTLDFGSFSAFGTRQKLDDAITGAAREKFEDPTMEVMVKQVAYPFAENPSIYLGQAYVSSPFGGATIHLGDQPIDVQGATLAGPTVDTKYITVTKKIGNLGGKMEDGTVIDEDHPYFVRRVVVYGTTGGFCSGTYPDIGMGHEDRLVGLGNKPLDNAMAANHKIGDYMDSILHMTSGYVLGRGDVDFMANETAYLQSHLADNGKPSKVQKITGRIGEVTEAIGAVKGLGATVRGE